MNRGKCELIFALDVPAPKDALPFLSKLDGAVRHIKIGPRLYAMGGVPFLMDVMKMGYRLFLDLKLHDIPNTVASAVEPLSGLGLWALTIHTSGGLEMMSRCVAARDSTGCGMKLFGITVLTSLGEKLWSGVHPGCVMNDALRARALAAELAGLDGIVCSPLDLRMLAGTAQGLLRIVPGIRAAKAGAEDQARTASAAAAAGMGADFIVVGRPILEAADPIKKIKEIQKDISEV